MRPNIRNMKAKLFSSCLAFLAITPIPGFLLAQKPEQPAKEEAPKTGAKEELGELVATVREKIGKGQHSEADYQAELKRFDELEEKYASQKDDDAAAIPFMRGTLYLQVFGDMDKGEKMLQKVKADYPGTRHANAVDDIVATLKDRAAAEKKKEELVGKAAPELKFKWSNRKGLTTLSGLKGKVVVLDFWATWCGPCVQSFPNIKELTDHYKGYDVEVIGVTSIQGQIAGLEAQPIDCSGDEAKEEKLMGDFIKAKDINWTIAISEDDVFDPDYGVNSIPHMTIVGPDGKVAKNGIHPGMTPLEEKVAIIDKLLKDANLKTPPAS